MPACCVPARARLAQQMKVLVGNVNKVNKAFQHMGKQTEVIIKAMNNAIVKNLKNIFKGHPIIFKLELMGSARKIPLSLS